MLKTKSKKTTVFLMFITIFLIGAIFYISTLLTSGSENKTSQVAPRKTKAANITYSKLIALNQTAPEEEVTPEREITPEQEVLTPTLVPSDQQTVSDVETESTAETPTPSTDSTTEILTPTETVLAYVNPTTTSIASSEAVVTTQIPTKVKSLPDSGFIYNGLIIFAAAMVLVFFSFLF